MKKVIITLGAVAFVALGYGMFFLKSRTKTLPRAGDSVVELQSKLPPECTFWPSFTSFPLIDAKGISSYDHKTCCLLVEANSIDGYEVVRINQGEVVPFFASKMVQKLVGKHRKPSEVIPILMNVADIRVVDHDTELVLTADIHELAKRGAKVSGNIVWTEEGILDRRLIRCLVKDGVVSSVLIEDEPKDL